MKLGDFNQYEKAILQYLHGQKNALAPLQIHDDMCVISDLERLNHALRNLYANKLLYRTQNMHSDHPAESHFYEIAPDGERLIECCKADPLEKLRKKARDRFPNVKRKEVA